MVEPAKACPACGQRGRAVPGQTVQNLVNARERAQAVGTSAMFCATDDCAVVYFNAGGVAISKAEVRVPVFQKESSPQRPVCYCFEHSVAEVHGAGQLDGSNAIVDEIMDACRRGLDRCEETNPQGRCCLGNIRGLLRDEDDKTCCGGCA